MEKYHKIQTVFNRDPDNKYKTLLDGEYSKPEFEYLKDNKWYFTEKIDGTNTRVMWIDKKLTFGGKTDNSSIPTFLLIKLQQLFTSGYMFQAFPDYDVCLYGEGYGAKIQKGGGNYISDGVDFILFDVKIGNWWLKRSDVEDVACKLNINCVPIVGSGVLSEGIEKAKSGFGSTIGIGQAEGLVMKPVVDILDRNGQRIVTKIKTKDFAGVAKR